MTPGLWVAVPPAELAQGVEDVDVEPGVRVRETGAPCSRVEQDDERRVEVSSGRGHQSQPSGRDALPARVPYLAGTGERLLEAQRCGGEVPLTEQDLAQARLNLSYCRVLADIDGFVSNRNVNPGDRVSQGQRLMAIRSSEEIWVDCNFKETQIGLMRVGQPVTIAVDALSSHDLKGRVASFSPGTGAQFALIPPKNATGNFTKIVQRVPVRIRFKAGGEARKVLIPGLSVVVSVDTRGARDDQGEEDEETDEPKVSEAGPGAQPAQRTRSAKARP